MKIRTAAVAGSFYPGTKKEIDNLLDRIFSHEKQNIQTGLSTRDLIGAVVPHAGYVFSAYEAVHVFEILSKSPVKYDTFFIINPNHTGYGKEIEVDSNENWQTPLGSVEIDMDFVDNLDLPVSNTAQASEHSAEVMLPFLQKWLSYPFKIVPICILRQNPLTSKEIAEKIFKANQLLKKKIFIIASSDFSHYVDPQKGKEKDTLVLNEIEKLDSGHLYDAVIRNRISVCGYGPIMTLIEYARLVSQKPETTILARGNSGKTMPSSSVVDYVSVLFYQ
jgi:AmmeMemoRadiSam system protein B